MEDVNLITFEAEFSELEQLAVDTIQRRVSHSMLPINRKRNRYQGTYICVGILKNWTKWQTFLLNKPEINFQSLDHEKRI